MPNMEQAALPYVELSDDRVRLRPLAEDDVDALVRACADPLIPKFTFWPSGLSAQQARERVRQAEQWRISGARLELAVADGDSDALLGFVGLAPDWRDRRAGVFYWTAPWARGCGVARRALSLIIDWAVQELGFERLELESDVDNIASQRVAEAVGFQREGILRARRLRQDGRCDSVAYGLLIPRGDAGPSL